MPTLAFGNGVITFPPFANLVSKLPLALNRAKPNPLVPNWPAPPPAKICPFD